MPIRLNLCLCIQKHLSVQVDTSRPLEAFKAVCGSLWYPRCYMHLWCQIHFDLYFKCGDVDNQPHQDDETSKNKCHPWWWASWWQWWWWWWWWQYDDDDNEDDLQQKWRAFLCRWECQRGSSRLRLAAIFWPDWDLRKMFEQIVDNRSMLQQPTSWKNIWKSICWQVFETLLLVTFNWRVTMNVMIVVLNCLILWRTDGQRKCV